MNELALFAGAGGGILGGKLLGWRTVCAVEIDAYAREVLAARQNDGCLEPFPIWDDVRTFDGVPWRGIVDVVSGGFPCQDISVAGKGAGLDGERSGLWREFARIVGEVRPRFVLVENSPALVVRGLGRVLGDLAALGYDARWGVLGAVHAGAPHRRDRIWIVANTIGAQDDGKRRTCKCGRDALGRIEQATLRGDGQAGAKCACGCGEDVPDAKLRGVSFRRRTEVAGGRGEQQIGIHSDVVAGGEEQTEAMVSDADGAGYSRDGKKRVGAQIAEAGGNSKYVPDAQSARCVAGGVGSGDAPNGETPLNMRTIDGGEVIPHTDSARRGEQCPTVADETEHETAQRSSWWCAEPAVSGMVDGLAAALDLHGAVAARYVGRLASGVPLRTKRITALGNGQVPACVRLAWEILAEQREDI